MLLFATFITRTIWWTEAATRGVLWKKVLLEVSQNSQDNNCARVSFKSLLKKGLWHRCFPVNCVKFVRTHFLQNTSRRLLSNGMNSVIWWKMIIFSQHLFSQHIQIFMFLVNPKTSKSVTSLKALIYIRSYTLDCFFIILGSIKMEYDQILVWLMTKTSNSFLPLMWRLENSFRYFCDFGKIVA